MPARRLGAGATDEGRRPGGGEELERAATGERLHGCDHGPTRRDCKGVDGPAEMNGVPSHSVRAAILAFAWALGGCGLLLDSDPRSQASDGGVRIDSGRTDAGPMDAGPMDAGPMDAEIVDGSPIDATDDRRPTDAGMDGVRADTGVMFPSGSLVLFVTSDQTDGAMGGLPGADDFCRNAARTAGLGLDALVALLSDSGTDARARIAIDAPVVNTRGELLANDLEDLFDGTILTPVRYSETGASNYAVTYTGTNTNGARDMHSGQMFCGDWTDTTAGNAQIGRSGEIDGQWIAAYSESDVLANPCRNPLSLYCIGVVP